MTTVDRIQKLGFKRWYERTLIESHAYLVTSFLGMIVTFAGLELIGDRHGLARFSLGFAAAVSGAILVAFGVHRYYRILVLAESLGNRATCPQCRTYAAFNVLACGMSGDHERDSAAPVWLKVQCRRCGNQWRM